MKKYGIGLVFLFLCLNWSFAFASGTCEYKYPDGSLCGKAVSNGGYFCSQHQAELDEAYALVYGNLEEMKEEEEKSISSPSQPSSSSKASSGNNQNKYSGKCYSEVPVMATPDGAVTGISYLDKQTNDSAIIYIYSLGSESAANDNWIKYQSVLKDKCGLSLKTESDGLIYVYNDSKLVSILGTGYDDNYGGYFLDISFDANNNSSSSSKTDNPDKKKEENYKAAVKLYDEGKYEEAAKAFEALGNYRNSSFEVRKCKNMIAYNEAYPVLWNMTTILRKNEGITTYFLSTLPHSVLLS